MSNKNINIEDLRRESISKIKEIICKNPKFTHPCNKNRLEFQEKLKFKSGYEFTGWMQRNGIINNPADIKHEEMKKTIDNAGCKNKKEYQQKCFFEKCENVEYKERTDNCERCGNKLIAARKEYRNKTWSGKWLCASCSEKLETDWRNNNLNPYCSVGKGYIFQRVTCIARQIEDLNIINDNFQEPIDHSIDPELGIVDTQCRILQRSGVWQFKGYIYYNKEFDYSICHCVSRDRKIIERTYIIPKKEIEHLTGFSITKNPSKNYNAWFERYRVNEKPYTDAYQKILTNKDDILRIK